MPTYLWFDNLNVTQLAHNPFFHVRTNHIELALHFIQHHILQGTILLQYVPSSNQIGDLFTKALPRQRLNEPLMQASAQNLRPAFRLRKDVKHILA